MSNNFAGILINSFSDIIFKLQKYYITIVGGHFIILCLTLLSFLLSCTQKAFHLMVCLFYIFYRPIYDKINTF